jgi:hypothetical protein
MGRLQIDAVKADRTGLIQSDYRFAHLLDLAEFLTRLQQGIGP